MGRGGLERGDFWRAGYLEFDGWVLRNCVRGEGLGLEV